MHPQTRRCKCKKNGCENLNEQQTCMTLKQKGALNKRLIILKCQKALFFNEKIGNRKNNYMSSRL
jgi:hypothetical protein